MKWIIKLTIVVLVGAGLILLSYMIAPQYDKSELYEVSGICTDTYIIEGHGRHSYNNNKYFIVMDNGDDYRISKKLWKYIGGSENIVGRPVSFSASGKALSWWFEHDIVSWNDSEENREITFEMTNDTNRLSVIIWVVVAIIIGSLVMTSEILELLQKRYEKTLKKVSRKNREVRRAKRQAKRDYFNDPNNIPNAKNKKKR